MKTRLYLIYAAIILVAVFLGVAILRGAQGPALIEKPQLASFAATPLYDASGALVSFHCTATFKVLELKPDGRSQTPGMKAVNFDLVQQGSQSVVLGNQLVEFADIGDDLLGVCAFAFKLHHPDPLPTHPVAVERRRSIRAK